MSEETPLLKNQIQAAPRSSPQRGGRPVRRALAWAAASIRNRGWWTTLQVAFSVVTDVFFDWRFGTDTFQIVNIAELQSSSSNVSHAVRYQATKARPLRKLLHRLQLPHDAVFLDYGSGKGRALMLAARERFKRVVGVDFSPRLCAVARQNVETFRRKVRGLAPIEIVEGDATTHPLSHDENVFFFYNPFDEVILARVVEKIRESVATHPRPVWLIYCTPRHAEVIERSSLFSRREAFSFGGTEFRVYSNPNGAATKPAGSTP